MGALFWPLCPATSPIDMAWGIAMRTPACGSCRCNVRPPPAVSAAAVRCAACCPLALEPRAPTRSLTAPCPAMCRSRLALHLQPPACAETAPPWSTPRPSRTLAPRPPRPGAASCLRTTCPACCSACPPTCSCAPGLRARGPPPTRASLPTACGTRWALRLLAPACLVRRRLARHGGPGWELGMGVIGRRHRAARCAGALHAGPAGLLPAAQVPEARQPRRLPV